MKIESRDPRELSVHPVRKHLPQLPGWEKKGDHFGALVEDIRLRGFDTPLIIDPENRVIKGEPRWRAACQLQLAEVPVIVRKGSDVAHFILSEKLLRGQLPDQSAKAYWAWPLIERAFEENKALHHARVLAGLTSVFSQTLGKKPRKMEDFAAELGICRDYLFKAREVYELFNKYPEERDITDKETCEVCERTTFREYYGSRLLLGRVSIGAVKPGILSHLSMRGAERPTVKYLRLFNDAFKRLGYFGKLNEVQRREASKLIHERVATWDEATYSEVRAAVRAREKSGK